MGITIKRIEGNLFQIEDGSGFKMKVNVNADVKQSEQHLKQLFIDAKGKATPQ